jgi:hypothetical protein
MSEEKTDPRQMRAEEADQDQRGGGRAGGQTRPRSKIVLPPHGLNRSADDRARLLHLPSSPFSLVLLLSLFLHTRLLLPSVTTTSSLLTPSLLGSPSLAHSWHRNLPRTTPSLVVLPVPPPFTLCCVLISSNARYHHLRRGDLETAVGAHSHETDKRQKLQHPHASEQGGDTRHARDSARSERTTKQHRRKQESFLNWGFKSRMLTAMRLPGSRPSGLPER